MKWHSNDRLGEPAEHGTNSADFYSTATERGVKDYLNWPVMAALGVAVLVLLTLFLLR